MGLCKCPRKKVTNLFCFEHKVNVCEHCLVENHDKCIVKSYLQWLEDSDYNPICSICDKHLQTGEIECVRLICYDVFHLKCLNEIASKLPDTTAPAGYECPSCSKPIIPQSKQIGPLVDNLKSKLEKSDWFQRATHGKISDDMDIDNFEFVEPNPQAVEQKVNNDQIQTIIMTKESQSDMPKPNIAAINKPQLRSYNMAEEQSNVLEHTVYQMPDIEDQAANIRKSAAGNKSQQSVPIIVSAREQRIIETDDKYSRRSLVTHLSTLIKAHFPYSTSKRSPQRAYYYFMLSLVLGLVIFVILLWFFSVLGRYSADHDPMLDPRFNPNLLFDKDNKVGRVESDNKDNQFVRGGSNIEPPKIRM